LYRIRLQIYPLENSKETIINSLSKLEWLMRFVTKCVPDITLQKS
jgi:hypothetical protein